MRAPRGAGLPRSTNAGVVIAVLTVLTVVFYGLAIYGACALWGKGGS